MSHFYTNAFIHKNKIYYSGYDNGERVMRKGSYEPYVFLPTGGPYKTIEGKKCTKKSFDSMAAANKFLKDHRDISNFEFYGNTAWLYTWINDAFPGQIDFDPSLIRVNNWDIEVASDEGVPDYRNPDKPITAISVERDDKFIVFGYHDIDKQKVLAEEALEIEDFTYIRCKDEEDLIRKFLKFWNHPDWSPDVITGWHIEGFDIPYFYCRTKFLLGEDVANTLSPWGIVEEREINWKGGRKDLTYDIKGISVLDYLSLYKKFSFKNHESYALNHIAFVEVDARKIDYSEHESLLDLFKEDYNKFIAYNLWDVALVKKLDKKLGLINQVYSLAYDGKVIYADTLASVRMWDTIIHNYLLEQNIVVPQPKQEQYERELIGGYVKDVIPGMYDWVLSVDLQSLYPHLIMQYNISPDVYFGKLKANLTLQEVIDGRLEDNNKQLKEHNLSCAANLCLFNRDKQGFLAALMDRVYSDRAIYKGKMKEAEKLYEQTKDEKYLWDVAKYNNLQMAKKIQLNSAYGAVANKYFRFHDIDLAEAVTASGQLSIRWIANRINWKFSQLLNKSKDYVIAIDTDSLYINFGEVVNEAMCEDKTKAEIVHMIDCTYKGTVEPLIEQWYKELAEYTNAYENRMVMNREVIADKGVWTAKKRYVLNVWDSEGIRYDEPKLKIQGLESVRSSTPYSCRGKIEQALKIALNQDRYALLDFVDDFRKEFKTLPLDEIASPRSINGLRKYHDTGKVFGFKTPLQVRGALVYNHLLEHYELTNKFPRIHDGDKAKYVYLKMPNPIHQNVITFINTIPKQFDVDDYIDYETQFEKGFLDPLSAVTSAIGWRLDNSATLEGFL